MAAKVPETTTTKKDTRAGRTLKAELHAIVTRLQTDVEVPKTSGVGGDFLDVAQDIEHQELARLSASRLTERARRVRVALTRVSSGEYGVCSECGASIPPKRLLAVPEATTCVPCQERLERGRAAVA
jgi:phage/conjugal plasmid C-4 type zinc finger TraR family protein